MRLGIDYTAAIHQSAGIGRYVRELTRALCDLRPAAAARLFVAGARRADLGSYPGSFAYCPSPLSERTHARLWHRLHLPLPVERWTGPLDLFHATDFALPPTRPGTKTVLTIPDLAFERYPGETMPGMLAHLRRIVPRSVARADRVVAISEATRTDIIDLYSAPPDKVIAIPLGVDNRFRPDQPAGRVEAVRTRYHLPTDRPLILTVGTMQPRKNHLRLVQAFGQIDSDAVLVIAGGQGWQYDAVLSEVERLGLTDRVIFTGFVEDNDLPALYRAATIFAYPALYEGFGLPVLEAMACGLPVVTSNVSSLPEVTGEDGALLVDPLDVDALTAALSHLLADADLRHELADRGVARAHTYTWTHTAELMWALYDDLASD